MGSTQLLSELQKLTASPPSDPVERRALLNALRDAQFAVEQPTDVVHRLSFAPLQASVARVAGDLKLFDLIAAATQPISLEELASKTGAAPLLIRRILRFCSLYGLVHEPEPTKYLPSEGTKSMAHPGLQAGVKHNHDVLLPAWQKLPEFLESTKYQDMTNFAQTPFQTAWNTADPAFVWALTQPVYFQNFNIWMAAIRNISPSWLDKFPAQYLSHDSTSTAPLFIDVGGGIGHQCEELKRRYTDITRPVVLQDLPPAIQHALPTAGVDNQVYNFFEEQPIKEASYYYFKSVLHDWPDNKAIEILRNQVSALGPNSALLIDEIVLPEKGGHWRAVEMDIALMASVASIERTEEQWKALFAEVGLKLKEKFTYDDQMLYAVMVVVKA